MSTVDLARTQFAATTLFHFLFVPITIGTAWLTAIMQTAWRRTGNEEWLRLTRFFGKLLLINVALGVATGLVQEFQFGMNWAVYSRFVGDVFGAPLAIEGLAAFFLESTFLGIWIFGWNRLNPKLHLATIYLAALGATLSAVFILAANSWMQHPTGYSINPDTGRAQLDNIGAVLTNPVFIWALAHTLLAAFVAASSILLGIACWNLRKGRHTEIFRKAAVLGLVVLFPATGLSLMTGARLAVTITELQPMKTASMEALWDTEAPASFSLIKIGGNQVDDQKPAFEIEIPHLLSILATNSWDGQVQGINQLQQQESEQYGPGNYIPVIPFAYWGLRLMAYVGTWMLVMSGIGLFLLWRRKLESARWFHRLAVWSIAGPFLINIGGWVLAETGRQPWIVWGLQQTADASSPSVSTTQVVITLVGFVVLYGALAAVDGWLMFKYGRKELEEVPADWEADDSDDSHPTKIPALSY